MLTYMENVKNSNSETEADSERDSDLDDSDEIVSMFQILLTSPKIPMTVRILVLEMIITHL